MLTRLLSPRRAAGCCAGAAAITICAVWGAPGAQAAGTVRSQPASFGPGATVQLVKDTANAWKITQGSGVIVAVLSTGVDPNAVGLAGKVTTGDNYVNRASSGPVDGTILASAIAGSGPTSASPVGPIGRAPAAKILGIRIWPDPTEPGAAAFYNNVADDSGIVASAITEAVNKGAKVIYEDEVEGEPTLPMEQAVQYAISKNVVVICPEQAYGSEPDNPTYPTSLPGVLGAGAVSLPGLIPPSPQDTSPKNESILVAAPGNQFLASGPAGPDYFVQNYYSAAAWLIGTAALIKSLYPNISPALVARAIALSARDRPAGGYNTTVGFGLINPAGALQQASALAKLTATAAAGSGVASPSARLASGPAPGVIDAVHHSPVKLAGFGAAIVVGLACLLLVVPLARRGRRGQADQAGQGSVRIS